MRSSDAARGLGPYLPRYLAQRVAARGTVPSEPLEDSAMAATLFVDMAGFTQLTERLATRGPAGAEQLSEILNDYFARITMIVDAHGGDVVLFAGDAILAIWPAASLEELPVSTVFAAQCALEVHERLSGLELEQGIVLRQRAVVGAGPVSFYELGGVDSRWLPLVAGPALAAVPHAIREANVADVMLTQTAWELVADRCRGVPVGNGHVLLTGIVSRQLSPHLAEPPTVSDAQLSPYVPEVLTSRINAGHGEWIAEFRTVTVVFAGLAGLADGSGALDRIQLAAATLQRVLRQHEGTFYQIGMDDKGTVLIGVFGLPPLAQEDDALRGVAAALSFRAALYEAGLRSSIGVATGRAYCGICGAPWRRQYTIVGPVINLAARLMQSTSDSVLCDAATEGGTRARVDFDAPASISVKGLRGPIAAFVPKGLRSQPRSRPSLVGREDEDRRLRKCVQRLGEGGGGVVVLSGAAGIGKSSLLAAVSGHLVALPGLLLAGTAEAIEASTPYFAWREILRALLRAAPEEAGPPLAARLRARLGGAGDPELMRWCPLLNVVLPLGLVEDEITNNMPAEARAGALQQIVVCLLEQETSNLPVAIVLDDVQWLDSASAALAIAVVSRLPQILVIAATRPVDPTTAVPAAALLRARGVETIVLGPLSTEAVRALVRRCLGVEHVDDVIVRFIVERAEGHPFFSEELARAVRHSGVLGMAGPASVLALTDIRKIAFPDSVHAAITSRVDRLLPYELLALKIASAIGRSFSYGQLQEVYPIEGDRHLLRDGLENLERLELVYRQSDAESVSYAFKHALVQEAVYGLLPVSQKRRIHQRVARFYEERPNSSGSEVSPLLAHHWDEAGEARKAVFYLEKAAVEALRTFSTREAQSFLRRADELSSADSTLSQQVSLAVREKLHGEACYQQADYDGADRHYLRSLELRHRRVPRVRAALALDLVLQIGRQALTRARARPLYRVHIDRREELEHAALVFNRFSSIAWYRGDQLALVHSIFTVLNHAEESGDVSNSVHGCAAMAVLCGLVGWHKAATFYSDRALRMADESKNPSDAARAHINTAIYAIGSGLWQKAELHVGHALDLHRRLGDRQTWEASRSLNGYLHLARGAFGDATVCFDEVYRSARTGLVQSRIWARNGHLASQIRQGAVLPDVIEELAGMALEYPDTAESITAHGLVAQAHLRAGRASAALNSAELGLRRLMERKPGAVYYAFWGLAALAETWLSLLEKSQASRSARDLGRRAAKACGLLRSFARMIPIARPRSALCDGWLAAIEGRPRAAVRRLRTGLQIAARLEMPFDEALLHAEIAHRIGPDDPDRSRHAGLAAEFFEKQGARVEYERIGGGRPAEGASPPADLAAAG